MKPQRDTCTDWMKALDPSTPMLVVSVDGAVRALTPSATGLLTSWTDNAGSNQLRDALDGAVRDGTAHLSLEGRDLTVSLVPSVPNLLLVEGGAGARAATDRALALAGDLRDLVVHDLRALLQSLQASIETIALAPGGAEPDAIAQLRDQAQAVTAQMDRVIDLATGPRSAIIAAEAFDLPRLLGAAVALLSASSAQRGTTLTWSTEQFSGPLHGPPLIVHELVQNMIDNAVKFGGRSVAVVARRGSADEIALEVWQDGVGIPAEVLRHLQRSPSRDRKTDRRGTGLSVMRVCLALLHGWWEHSQEDGRSCLRARFRLPAATEVDIGPGASPEAAIREDSPLAGMRVLLVDDDSITRDWAATVLRKAGADLVAVASAEAALEALGNQEGIYDTLITDLTLPGLDGIALAKAVSTLPEDLRPRRTLALSGDKSDQTERACRDAGIASLVQKPISGKKLIQIMSPHVERGENNKSMHPGSPEPPWDYGSSVLDETTIAELADDLGKAQAERYMETALNEATGVMNLLKVHGLTRQTRPLVHSAVGSTGITGLRAVEAALRSVQTTGGETNALDELAEAISATRYRFRKNT